MESCILNFETPTGTEILITLLQNVLLLKLINNNCKNIDVSLSNHNYLLIAAKKKFAKPKVTHTKKES